MIPLDDRVLMILWMDRKIQNDEVVVVDVCYDRGNRRRMGVEDVGHEVVVVVVVDAAVVDAVVGEMDDSLNQLLHVVVEHAAFESVVVDRYPCDDDDGDDGNHHTEG